MRRIFDTNHAIAYLNGDPRLKPYLETAKASRDTFALTTTVLGELYYGAYTSQRVADNMTRLAAFVSQLIIYEFDEAAAKEFGKIKAEQRAKGKLVPTADAQIAAVARLHGLTILTNDSHFQQIEGLTVDNWLL